MPFDFCDICFTLILSLHIISATLYCLSQYALLIWHKFITILSNGKMKWGNYNSDSIEVNYYYLEEQRRICKRYISYEIRSHKSHILILLALLFSFIILSEHMNFSNLFCFCLRISKSKRMNKCLLNIDSTKNRTRMTCYQKQNRR